MCPLNRAGFCEDASTKKYLTEQKLPFRSEARPPYISVLSSSLPSCFFEAGLHQHAHGAKECLQETGNCVLHLKWFQMLKQSAAKRTDGSPPTTYHHRYSRVLFFKKKIMFRVGGHFPKCRDNFSHDDTNVCVSAKLNTFQVT